MSDTTELREAAPHARFRRVSVPERFREIARERPGALAFVADDEEITFRDLDLASNRVAHGLLARDRPGRPFAAVAGLDIASACVLWGALKAGHPFVPLDARASPQHWASVCAETDALLAVPDEATRAQVAALDTMIDVVSFADLRSDRDDDPELDFDPDACAFVFFTAGSTGRPKGTMVGHTLPLRWLQMFDWGPGDRVPLMAPLVFTGGTGAVMGVVLNGATGCFFDPLRREPSGFVDWMDDTGITLLTSVPSAVRAAASTAPAGRVVPSVRLVVLGSEPCTVRDVAAARALFPRARVVNCYGSSEAGAVARYDVPDQEADGPLPVGRPFPWLRVEIVDDAGDPVAQGEPGEIVVTGEDVALGYWNDPTLTSLRFAPAGVARSVRTGDRGRFRSDGMLEYLGRVDFRVKIRGQLVDPLAVEYELRMLPAIEDAVVSSVERHDGAQRLVAHLVTTPGTRVTAGELRRALSARLAPYMIPTAFFSLPEIPKTLSGKADRAALRSLGAAALPRDVDYVAPTTDVERSVAAVFAEALGLDRVGVDDNFFDLGGDSLSTLDVLAGVAEQLGSELTPADLLEHPTVGALARRASTDQEPVPGGQVLVRLTTGATRPSFFCVPGAGANAMFRLRPLAYRLASRTTYSFVPHGAYNRGLPDRSVRRLARRYVSALQQVDPVGPYFIGGHSFGGTVAHEMACQLEAARRHVALLVLLEPAVAIDEAELGRSVTRRVNEARAAHPGSSVGARLRRASLLLAAARGRVKVTARRCLTGVVLQDPSAQDGLFRHLHARLSRRHRPRGYTGRALVVRTSGFDELARIRPNVASEEFLVGERRVVDVGGDHLTMLTEPNVAGVADAIDDALAHIASG